MKLELESDAFSSSQLESKLWLVKNLEQVLDINYERKPWDIWILAGWYGVTNFLIRTRGSIPISKVRSFDQDPECEPIADAVNNLWVWQGWQFKAHTADVNELDYTEPPHIVINTATEHLSSRRWWDAIPAGTIVALQGNNLDHDDHVHSFRDLDAFIDAFPLTERLYEGTKLFRYDHEEFYRFMVIGVK